MKEEPQVEESDVSNYSLNCLFGFLTITEQFVANNATFPLIYEICFIFYCDSNCMKIDEFVSHSFNLLIDLF